MQTRIASSPTIASRRTQQIERPCGPFVFDIWDAVQPSGAAPILLLHGWGGTGSYWEETARFLAQTTQVIVPDLPGTGRSQPVYRAQNMYDQVESIGVLLDELGLDNVQIVGHSMGGAMAVLLTAQMPQRVERLVLTSVTFFMTKAQENIYHEVMRFFKVSIRFRPDWLASVPGVSNMMAKQYFHRLPSDKAVLQRGLRDYLELDGPTALACAMNATDSKILEAGEQVTAPTLMIVSRQDNMMPLENVEYTADIIGDCQVRWIESCGHLPMVEKPATYQTYLRDFLNL